MSVPEAAVDEYNGFVFWQHDIRRSRQVPAVQAETESVPVQQGADQKFRLGVPAADAGHIPTASLL